MYTSISDALQSGRYQAVIDEINKSLGSAITEGIRITAMGRGYADGELMIEPRHLNTSGIIHGGTLFMLADTVSGTASFSAGSPTVTVTTTMNYLNAKCSGKIFCHAEADRIGRSISVYRIMITAEDGTLIATGTSTFQAVHNQPSKPPKQADST